MFIQCFGQVRFCVSLWLSLLGIWFIPTCGCVDFVLLSSVLVAFFLGWAAGGFFEGTGQRLSQKFLDLLRSKPQKMKHVYCIH